TGFVREPFGEDVFQVGSRLRQVGQFARRAADLVGDLARPDVNPIHFEAHDSTLVEKWEATPLDYTTVRCCGKRRKSLWGCAFVRTSSASAEASQSSDASGPD